ncbi:hypothetical protein [Caloranaerobacter sp. DY30410]|uniref:hypothetical protein n=1 Tax=Caloranaerobacter sp. DY30410 TaxID=3238305 RepID=UPI003D08FF3E
MKLKYSKVAILFLITILILLTFFTKALTLPNSYLIQLAAILGIIVIILIIFKIIVYY